MENFGTFSLIEEESFILPDDELILETETQEKKELSSKNNLDFIVLAVNNPAFKITKPSYEIDVYGKTMLEWVKSVCFSEPIVAEVEIKHNILETVRPLLKESDYTVVLYSDSPLITRSTIEEAVEFTKEKGLNVCKLTHGYVFKTDYIKRAMDIFSTETFYFNEEDFLVAYNFKQLALINEILKNRILSFHMLNGVYVVDPSTTFIGSEVVFGKNVILHPNNNLYGKLEIGDNVTFLSDNLIGNSVIKSNSTILRSRIKKSVIGSNASVVYSSVDKSLVGDNVDIRMDSKIAHSEIGDENSIVGASIFGVKTGKKCIINANATLMSYKDEKIVLKDEVIIGAGVVVPIPIVVGKNVTVLPTTTVRNDITDNSIYGDKTEQTIKPKL